MKKREILAENNVFRLVKQTRDHKIWYELQLVGHWATRSTRSEILENEVVEFFGPSTVKYTQTWRFWNRIEAHKQFTFATLKWC